MNRYLNKYFSSNYKYSLLFVLLFLLILLLRKYVTSNYLALFPTLFILIFYYSNRYLKFIEISNDFNIIILLTPFLYNIIIFTNFKFLLLSLIPLFIIIIDINVGKNNLRLKILYYLNFILFFLFLYLLLIGRKNNFGLKGENYYLTISYTALVIMTILSFILIRNSLRIKFIKNITIKNIAIIFSLLTLCLSTISSFFFNKFYVEQLAILSYLYMIAFILINFFINGSLFNKFYKVNK